MKRVDDLGFYSLGRDQLAKKVGLSGPKTTAVIRFLKLKNDRDCHKQITIGKSKFDRYSPKAIDAILDTIKQHPIDKIWKTHGARSTDRPQLLGHYVKRRFKWACHSGIGGKKRTPD